MAYLAMHLYPCCAQRKSAVEGMTVEEYQTAVREENNGKMYWIVHVCNHKTASSKGPAQLVILASLKNLFDKYLLVRRGRGSSNLFFW